jgi:hypothetical protein
VSPAIVSDVNASDYNVCDIYIRTNNEHIRDQDCRRDGHSTVYDDIFYLNPALQAVTFFFHLSPP